MNPSVVLLVLLSLLYTSQYLFYPHYPTTLHLLHLVLHTMHTPHLWMIVVLAPRLDTLLAHLRRLALDLCTHPEGYGLVAGGILAAELLTEGLLLRTLVLWPAGWVLFHHLPLVWVWTD